MMNLGTATSSACFPKTQWTNIIGVIQHGESHAAFDALTGFCEEYRPAIYNFFRRRGSSAEQAEDFTQDFFTSRIIERWADRSGFLHALRKDECSRFRSFLCHVLWRFLQDKWKQNKNFRTGGRVTHVLFDEAEAWGAKINEQRFERFGQDFDRVFALEVIRRAAKRSRHSSYLEAHLRGEISQQAAAKELGISENAFKQSYCRFRERLAADLWDEVSKLVGPDRDEIRAELRYLMSLFAESPP